MHHNIYLCRQKKKIADCTLHMDSSVRKMIQSDDKWLSFVGPAPDQDKYFNQGPGFSNQFQGLLMRHSLESHGGGAHGKMIRPLILMLQRKSPRGSHQRGIGSSHWRCGPPHGWMRFLHL